MKPTRKEFEAVKLDTKSYDIDYCLADYYDGNYYGDGCKIVIYDNDVDVETIFTDQGVTMVHVSDREFEGDLKISSLSIDNQKRILDMIEKRHYTTEFLNYTPHDVVMNDGRVYKSVGNVRIENRFGTIENDVCEVTFGELKGLPDPRENTVYIISLPALFVANALGRRDCVAPATGHPDCVRKNGNIVSVPCFVTL